MSSRDSFKKTWNLLKERGFFENYATYEEWESKDEPKDDDFIAPEETPEQVIKREQREKEHKEEYERFKGFKGSLDEKDLEDFNTIFGE